MTEIKLPDLTIDLQPAGTVLLTQDAGCGEIETVALHLTQVRYLAELTGLLEPQKPPTQPASLKKRLLRLHDRLVDIHDILATVPIYPPGSGSSEEDPEVRALWDAITSLEDVVDDYFPREKPDQRPSGTPAGEFQLTA